MSEDVDHFSFYKHAHKLGIINEIQIKTSKNCVFIALIVKLNQKS